MHALWIPYWYPDPTAPHQNPWARELARAVAARCDVTVLHAAEGVGPDTLAVVPTPPALRLSYRPRRLHWVTPYLRAVARGARRIHAMRAFDLIHAHCAFPAGLAGLLLAARYRVPLVVTEHWGPYDQLMTSSRANAFALRLVLRRASAVVAVSSALRREMVNWVGRSGIDIIPPAVDMTLFRPGNQQRSFEDPVRLLFVGDLRHARKRLEDVLEAIALLVRRGEGRWVLEVIGEGALRLGYEAQARELDIDHLVRFRGALRLEGVAAAMRSCDIFVMPSSYETFGATYVEALASGKPIVGTQCGGPEDFVTDELGRLVPRRDVPALAQALAEVAAALSTFDPEQLRSVARARFSLEAVGERYSAIYRRVTR